MSFKQEQKFIISPLLSELNSDDLTLSEKMEKKWDFTKNDGTNIKGGYQFFHVYENKDSKAKASFVLEDVKSMSGIKVFDQKRGRLSINLTPELSALLRSKIDEPLKKKLFQIRQSFMSSKAASKSYELFADRYNGVVTDGKPKTDNEGNEIGDNWPDQITFDVFLKSGQLDTNLHTIQDSSGQPYVWTQIERQPMQEVICTIDTVKIKKEGGKFDGVKVSVTFKNICLDAVSPPTYMSRRRIEQKQMQQQQEQTNNTAAAGANTTTTKTNGSITGQKRKQSSNSSATSSAVHSVSKKPRLIPTGAN